MRAVILSLAGIAALVGTLHFAAGGKPPKPIELPATKAEPGIVWRSGGAVIQLLDSPCRVDSWREELEEVGIPPARAYELTQGGKKLGGCWAPDPVGDVILRDASSHPDDLPTPVGWFKVPAGT